LIIEHFNSTQSIGIRVFSLLYYYEHEYKYVMKSSNSPSSYNTIK
jgi:hypothetical protein